MRITFNIRGIIMAFAFQHIAACAMLVASGTASAVAITIPAVGGADPGNPFGQVVGSSELHFSPFLLAAVNADGVLVDKVAPATVIFPMTSRMKYLAMEVMAPVTSLIGDVDGASLTVQQMNTAGGFLQTAEGDAFTNTGGFLSITNLRVDFAHKRVYADLNGGNGVGLKEGIHLWDYANITGTTSLTAAPGGVNTAVNDITGLKITTAAFNDLTRSLGLLPEGVSPFTLVTDYGRITSRISLVPEPATHVQMGLGLLALGALARRRTATPR